ncbi:MAG: hypothetical protein U0835_27280 [Isosphaeraceae bacterium]
MPLHDWSELAGREGMHHLWIAERLHWIKPRLPEGYRASVGAHGVAATARGRLRASGLAPAALALDLEATYRRAASDVYLD